MRKYLLLSGLTLGAVLAAWSCDDEDLPTTVPTPVTEVETFTAVLSPANEVPPVATAASGTATMSVLPGGLLVYRVDVVNLINPTLAHIHGQALAGANATVKVNFCIPTPPAPPCPNPTPGTPYTGLLAAGVATQVPGFSFDSLVVLLRNGNAYVNVHSMAFGGGEMRGQVVRAP
jgi:hypothetical protein